MSNKELKLNWDFSCFYSSDSDPKINEDISNIEIKSKEFHDKWVSDKEYLSNPKKLKQALDDYELLVKNYSLYSRVAYYISLRQEQDQENVVIKALDNKVSQLGNKVNNYLEFFTNRISKIPQETQTKILSYSGIAPYKHFLEKLFANAKYILSEEEEKILGTMSKTSHTNWVSMVSNFLGKEEAEVLDEEGKLIKKNLSGMLGNLLSVKKEVRDSSAKELNTIFLKHRELAENEINSILENERNIHELKKIDRPDKVRHIEDDIDSEIVDALVDGVSSNFALAHRFYKLKSQLVKVPKLKYHERIFPIGKLDTKYSYEDAVKMVKDVFGKLDPKFLEIYEEMLSAGNFDVYPYKGKRSGAFCAHAVNTNPIYVLLNFTNTLNDVTTIAHEMGHAINDHFMKIQNNLNYDVPLCIAEVSSTFMEDFVLEKLMEDADEETRLSLMMEKLNDDISTIFRQIACYKFEQELHKTFREKSYLSAVQIGEIFQKHMAAYMGDFVEQNEGSENWWVYWSHIRNFFYVYSYASGLIISKYMQRKYREDNKFIEKVKEFLTAGSNKSPKDIFLDLGIDISDKNFWIEGVKETEKLLNEAETLAKKLGKI